MGIAYDLVLLDSGYYSRKQTGQSVVDVYELDKGSWITREQTEDKIGHGTAVMSIISNNCAGRYAVFKVFNLRSEANLAKIKSALIFIYKSIECSFIQMSFGVRGYDEELDETCSKLYEKGAMILAAFDNYGAISFPAAFPYVIGVSGDVFCLRRNSFQVRNTGIVDVLSKSGSQIVKENNEEGFSLQHGNSFAVSYVSLELLQAKRQFQDKEEVLRYLDSGYKPEKEESDFQCLGTRAAVFPLNKEVYNLIHYTELLKINLVEVYDTKYAGNINRTMYNLRGDIAYVVKNIDHCNWNGFDTMVVGHLRELGMLMGMNLKEKILLQCLEHKKSVYCFDWYEVERFRSLFHEKNLFLECAEDYKKKDNYGKLYQHKTPVLAIMGTSKKQGKFTLQMQIMKVLRQKGIKLGVLGTEPNAILFGCDEMIPIGYDSIINAYSGQYMIEACNEKMHYIDKKGCNLIMVGGQSGFLPHFKFNSNQININQFAFLYGVQPDGMILVINYRDSVDYIEKSIKALQCISGGNVFLIGLYAFDVEYDNIIYASKRRLTQQEIDEKSSEIREKLGIPLIVCGDDSYDERLFQEIISYYCE